MKQAVVFGGGNIGRGFIGQLFSESEYQVSFIDVDEELIEMFNKVGSYRLQAVFNEEVTEHRIGPVRGIMATQPEAVDEVLLQADVAATAVGARALPIVAKALARGLARRAALDVGPLNIILCENLKNAPAIVREMVEEHTPPGARQYLEQQVGFVETVIGRMVPIQPAEQRAQDVGLVRVEPYKELPVDKTCFKGAIPTVASMKPVGNFDVYTARKLYIHNCGHALFAYMGYLKGYTYGYEALADDEIREFLFGGWQESLKGIVHRYDADPNWLREHMDDLFKRFQNQALGDTIFRLCRDPIRKLQPTDRLVAPAVLAMAAGFVPEMLCRGIAAAFHFDAEEDPVAQELQQRLESEGLDDLLAEICQIDPASPLGRTIAKHYEDLSEED